MVREALYKAMLAYETHPTREEEMEASIYSRYHHRPWMVVVANCDPSIPDAVLVSAGPDTAAPYRAYMREEYPEVRTYPTVRYPAIRYEAVAPSARISPHPSPLAAVPADRYRNIPAVPHSKNSRC